MLRLGEEKPRESRREKLPSLPVRGKIRATVLRNGEQKVNAIFTFHLTQWLLQGQLQS